MSTDATFNAMVNTRVPDVDSFMPTAKRDDAVQAAVAFWSKHRPQRLVADFSGDGSTFDFTLPADYDIDTSWIESIEYPVGDRDPDIMDAEDYMIYRSASATAKLRLIKATPATGETVRMIYTTGHVVDGSGSTIDARDENALADYAAGILCQWVSAYYSQSTDATLVVDSRNHVTQAQEYAARAKTFMRLAMEHLGIGSGSAKGQASGGAMVAAAGRFKDFDSERLDSSIRLTHPQK